MVRGQAIAYSTKAMDLEKVSPRLPTSNVKRASFKSMACHSLMKLKFWGPLKSSLLKNVYYAYIIKLPL